MVRLSTYVGTGKLLCIIVCCTSKTWQYTIQRLGDTLYKDLAIQYTKAWLYSIQRLGNTLYKDLAIHYTKAWRYTIQRLGDTLHNGLAIHYTKAWRYTIQIYGLDHDATCYQHYITTVRSSGCMLS